MTEEILIDIKLENADNDKRIDELTSSITDLTNETKSLQAEQQKLSKAGKENSQQYLDNAKQIEINKQKISENTASRKGLIQTIIAEDNSIKGLQVRNAELIKQRNLINTSTDDGKAKIAALNKQIDSNTEQIRTNSSSMEKQKMNIGNYASALDKLVPGLGSVTNNIYNTTQASGGFVAGMKDMVKASMAFIMTPIGAVIGAIGLALGVLINYLKTTGEGEDALARGTAALTGVFNQLKQTLNLLVEGVLYFSDSVAGKFIGQVTKMAVQSSTLLLPFQLLTAAFGDQTKAAADLADELDRASDAAGILGLKEKQVRNEIDLLIIQSKSKGLSDQARQGFLEQALQKEIDLTRELSEQKQTDLANNIKAIELENKAAIQAVETIGLTNEEIANELLKGSKITDDQRANLIKYLGDIEDVRGRSLEIQAKIQNRSIASEEKEAAAIEKAEEQKRKATEQTAEQNKKDFEDALKISNESVKQFEKDSELRNEIADNDLAKDLENINAELTARKDAGLQIDEIEVNSSTIAEQEYSKKAKAAREYQDLLNTFVSQGATRQQAEMKLSSLRAQEAANSLGALTTAFEENTVAYKVSATTRAIANTWASVTQILSEQSLLPFPASVIAKGIAIAGSIATGFTAVRNITAAAGGGDFITTKPTLLLVGDNPGGRERVTVEPLSGRGRTVVGDGLIKMAGGGTLTTVGSDTRMATAQAQSQFDLNQMAQLINQVQTVLVLEQFEMKRNTVAQTNRQATVI